MDHQDHAPSRGDARVRGGRRQDPPGEGGSGGPDPGRAAVHPRPHQHRVAHPGRPRQDGVLLRGNPRGDGPRRHPKGRRDVRQVRRSDRGLRRQPSAPGGARARGRRPGVPRQPGQDAAALPGRDPLDPWRRGPRTGPRARARRDRPGDDRTHRAHPVQGGVMAQAVEARHALVEMSMREFVERTPTLRFAFFGGKGGVGKTVAAGMTALWFAGQGRRTLLASTNPVHSLSGMLGQDVFGRHTPVDGIDNLWAFEIDTRDAIERSKKEIREKVQWFLKFAEISTKADEFVEAATTNPAFEESAMFENMVDLMFEDKYEAYVFDTAPTANARRLLGMSKVYGLWVEKMVKSREEAQTLREALSFTKKKEEDPLMLYLVDFRKRIEHARELLTDPEKTAFFFVTLPEALPIAVIRRFIDWFTDFGIPVGGVIVNMVIDREQAKGGGEFVTNRVAMQEGYLREIRDTFDGRARALSQKASSARSRGSIGSWSRGSAKRSTISAGTSSSLARPEWAAEQ